MIDENDYTHFWNARNISFSARGLADLVLPVRERMKSEGGRMKGFSWRTSRSLRLILQHENYTTKSERRGTFIILPLNICLDRANLFTAEHAESAEFFLCFLRELCGLCGDYFGCGWRPRYGVLSETFYESYMSG
ncbi:MAG: hypothetical protein Q7T47_04260, partial [Anaerolineales bacterium]|nr:hypothetical protein [Anaerolineales bacterium]